MSRSALWRTALLTLAPLAVSATAHGQRATAKVASRVDVNGDQRLDEVRIDEDGSISVLITGDEGAGAWTPLAASGKVVGGSIAVDATLVKGRTIILATSKLGRRGRRTFTEAVALAWTPGKLETLWRGKLGAQGPDGGSSLSVELGQYGLIKYASRAGVSRCDGEAAHLDAERYDFASGRFRPARQAMRMDAADAQKPLVAGSARPDFIASDASAFWFRAASASSAGYAASAAELVAPLAIADGNDSTAWTENKGGAGAGEFVSLRSSVGSVKVKALRLVLGHGAARKDFNRPKRLGLILGEHEKYWVDVRSDPRGPLWVVLPKTVPSNCVSLVLGEVYPKRALPRTAISEVTVFSEEELDPARSAEFLADRIASGKSGADTQRLLARLGAGAAGALLSAISKAQRQSSPSPKSITNLRLALAGIPAAPVELVAGLTDDTLRPRQHSVFSQALRGLQDASITPLSQALRGSALSQEATSRVTGLLAQLPQQLAAQALLDVVGSGSLTTRSAVVRALSRRSDAWSLLPAALNPANSPARQADLYRAMGLAGESLAAGSDARSALAVAITNSAANASSLGYEAHYRLIAAAGQLGGDGNISTLLAQVDALSGRTDAEGLALLRRAVASLGRLASKEPASGLRETLLTSLRSALEHTDPGVRLAVLSELPAKVAPTGAMESRLASDSWPEVRRAAAAALSTRCDDASADALRQAALNDTNTKVARTAFGGILRCEGPGRFELALKLVNSNDRPLELRLQAARSLGELASPGQAKAVVTRFSKARRLALAKAKSGKIASALSRALADLGTPEAIAALESSAGDPAFPELQAASITALGTLCPPSSRQLLQRLRQSNEHSVSNAATMAARRCSSR